LDGTNQKRVTTNSFLDADPSWQPVLSGYARPSGTPRMYMSLVPAFNKCASANRTHGPPLAHPSCAPPVQASPYLTAGTPDANGKPAGGVSSLWAKVWRGDPATTADEADLKIVVKMRDVFRRSDLKDYPGEMRAELRVRVTDRWNTPYPGGAGPGTGSFNLTWTVPCRATSVTSRGGDCILATFGDALVPGLVKESQRAIWQLEQIRLFDGGADYDGDTTADNRLFAVQGVFIP